MRCRFTAAPSSRGIPGRLIGISSPQWLQLGMCRSLAMVRTCKSAIVHHLVLPTPLQGRGRPLKIPHANLDRAGDILTLFEAQRRMRQQGCLAVMAARGALVKPWLFREWQQQQEWLPTAEERVAIYRSAKADGRSGCPCEYLHVCRRHSLPESGAAEL